MTPPTGHLALVFTDVESSTALWVALGDGFREALARHDALLREAMVRFDGYEVKAMGDAFMVAFRAATPALAFCLAAQEALAREPWVVSGAQQSGTIRVRMGLHVGEPVCLTTPGTGRLDYLGPMVIKASRLHVAGHGGQILLSDEARRELESLPPMVDLGEYALRGLDGNHRIWQVGTGVFPRLRTAELLRTNLQSPPDRFIGRAREQDALRELLRAGERLITLTGPGGTGKTRLASRVARLALDDLVGSSWLIDLGEARSEEDVLRATAEALGLPLGADAVAQLGHAIAGRGPVLLVFDNFEQVVAHGAVLGRWLGRAPEARMLVTSRVPLRLRGEHIVPLEPLPEADGVALFRARALVAPADDEPLAELAAALDGLPLAIELAAARTNALRPAQILARLQDRFRLLISGGKGRPSRHATLRAAMDWSWDLLGPAEQRALARLSVFEGGFSLEAAEAVLETLTATWPLDLVSALVEHSLLRRTGDRFVFLSTVHDYAREKLGSESRDAEWAHAAWFARLGTEAALESSRRAGGAARLLALHAERDNLLAAARRGPAEAAANAAVAAWELTELHGPFDEGERLLSLVLDRDDLSEHQRLRLMERRAEALRLMGRLQAARIELESCVGFRQSRGERQAEGRARGRLSRVLRDQGLIEAAREQNDLALALARAAGDRDGEATELAEQGLLARTSGQPDQARRAYDAALLLFRALGDRRGEAVLLGGIGNLEWEQGHGAEARKHYETALGVHRALGNRRAEAVLLHNLGVVHRALGHRDMARVFYESSLALHREIGNRRSEGLVLGNLANLLATDAPGEALLAYEAALAIHREVGNRRSETVDLGNMGALHLERGHLEASRAALTRALDSARELGLRQAEGVFAGKMALLLLAEGDPGAALEATEAGELALRAVGDPVELGRLLVVRARAALALGDRDLAHAALGAAEALAASCDSVELVGELGAVRGMLG